MRVTVLGKSPSWPDAGGASSAYLVEDGETALLLDCGNGVFSKLRERLDYLDLDAVVLTHLHADHWLDLVTFANALIYSPRQSEDPVRPLLIAPPGAAATFRRSLAPIGGVENGSSTIEDAFALTEHDEAGPLEVSSLRLTFHEVPHFIQTFAVRIVSGSGAVVVFGADCGPSEALLEAGRDADLLFVEGTITEPDEGDPPGHMTPRQAGEQARLAGARLAVITHFTDEVDADWVRAEGEGGFGGPIELAREGATYDL